MNKYLVVAKVWMSGEPITKTPMFNTIEEADKYVEDLWTWAEEIDQVDIYQVNAVKHIPIQQSC